MLGVSETSGTVSDSELLSSWNVQLALYIAVPILALAMLACLCARRRSRGTDAASATIAPWSKAFAGRSKRSAMEGGSGNPEAGAVAAPAPHQKSESLRRAYASGAGGAGDVSFGSNGSVRIFPAVGSVGPSPRADDKFGYYGGRGRADSGRSGQDLDEGNEQDEEARSASVDGTTTGRSSSRSSGNGGDGGMIKPESSSREPGSLSRGSSDVKQVFACTSRSGSWRATNSEQTMARAVFAGRSTNLRRPEANDSILEAADASAMRGGSR